MYKLFLALRYLRTGRIAYFAIAAVTLCTAMVLTVSSVMGGFLDTVKKQARGLLGDVIMDNARYQGFPLYDEFIASIAHWPEIVRATPVIYTAGLIRFPDTDVTQVVNVVGVRLRDVYEVNAFKSGLFYEKHFPGTTTLDDQLQPVMGLSDDNRLMLPPEFERALAASKAAGVVDDESHYDAPEFLKVLGVERIPGVHGFDSRGLEPRMAEPAFPGLVIGRDIVAQRKPDGRYYRFPFYPRGYVCSLTLWPIGVTGLPDATPVRQPFRYADDSRTGIYEIDSRHVYCRFELLQQLLLWQSAERETGGIAPGRCSQVQIKIRDDVARDRTRAADLCERLTSAYRQMALDPRYSLDDGERGLIQAMRALTWEQSQAHIIGPVEKERFLVTTLFALISLISVVLVMCILYMIVLRKTRDIGTIQSIGGSPGGVAAIFLIYGAAVGFVGAAVGVTLGWLFVTNINGVQAFLISLNPAWQVWDRSVYSFDEIPSSVETRDMVIIFVCSIVASTFGALAAAWRAGTMRPVEALRYE